MSHRRTLDGKTKSKKGEQNPHHKATVRSAHLEFKQNQKIVELEKIIKDNPDHKLIDEWKHDLEEREKMQVDAKERWDRVSTLRQSIRQKPDDPELKKWKKELKSLEGKKPNPIRKLVHSLTAGVIG